MLSYKGSVNKEYTSPRCGRRTTDVAAETRSTGPVGASAAATQGQTSHRFRWKRTPVARMRLSGYQPRSGHRRHHLLTGVPRALFPGFDRDRRGLVALL